jgi:hypothetical protein
LAKPSEDARGSVPVGPYRTNAPRPPEKRRPQELVYSSFERDFGMSGLLKSWFFLFTVPFLAFGLIGGLAGPVLGVVAAAGALWSTLRWQRGRRLAGKKVLHVEKGVLTVEPRAEGARGARFSLRDLDVVLDTKTIRKVLDGDAMLPVVRFTSSKIGPELDLTRIVLSNDLERYAMSEHFLSYTEALEWFGKIRVFLRSHGWVPADEREGADL